MVSQDNHQVSPVSISFTEELSEGIFLIGFKRNFIFKAGQVIGIALEQNGPRRLYSICSGEQEEEIHILYKVVDEGFLTPQLSDLEIGDTIWITAPGGEFTGDKDPAVWIATGTGIAPFTPCSAPGWGRIKLCFMATASWNNLTFMMNSRGLLTGTTSDVAVRKMAKMFTRGGLPDTWKSSMS